MTALQEKMVELAEYSIGFNMYDGNFLVNVTYKDGWSVIAPSDESITFMRDDKRQNTYYYSAPLTTDMSKIFSVIDETIAYNKELEEKVKLFRTKVEELQDVFTQRPIAELRKMRFEFPTDSEETAKKPKKAARKRKATPKPKEAVKTEGPEPSAPEKAPETNPIDEAIESAMRRKGEEVMNASA